MCLGIRPLEEDEIEKEESAKDDTCWYLEKGKHGEACSSGSNTDRHSHDSNMNSGEME